MAHGGTGRCVSLACVMANENFIVDNDSLGECVERGEHGDAGDHAATGISSTSRSMSGYQRLQMTPSSPLSVRTRVCNNKCAPSLDQCICYFLQNRLLTTSFTVDSTNPVAIASPWRYRSPSFGRVPEPCG